MMIILWYYVYAILLLKMPIKEKTVVTRYRAFNIANVVSRFEGTKLKTIKIIVPEQTGDSPKIEEGSNNGYKDATYTINDYDKYVTNN